MSDDGLPSRSSRQPARLRPSGSGAAAFASQGERRLADDCTHIDGIRKVTPSAKGCEECLKTGSPWVHLRLCRTCGHVGCCDSSPNKHATKHHRHTGHPIVEGYDPPEGWGYCYVDDVMLDLEGDTTPQLGPIPRYV